MPAASSARSRRRPAGPTKGRPERSSSSPGCSPTRRISAVAGPSPNTVCVPRSHSGQARQPAAARRSEGRVGCSGTRGAAVCSSPRSGVRRAMPSGCAAWARRAPAGESRARPRLRDAAARVTVERREPVRASPSASVRRRRARGRRGPHRQRRSPAPRRARTALALRADGAARARARRGDRPGVRTRRAAAPPLSPVLVSVARRAHGHGLAQLRDHDERRRSAPARARAARARARPARLRRARAPLAPDALTAFGERTGLDGAALARTSRLVAKVDGAAVQDGYALYLHAFFVAEDGRWAVVQQGMDTGARRARRYHWLSEGLESFVDEPHAAIEGRPRGAIVNLVDRRAGPSRAAQLALARDGPDRVVAEVRRLAERTPSLVMPAHHDVRAGDVVLRRLHGALAAAAERGPADFADLLLTPGLGARTVLALAMAAEVVHGAPCRFTDPARFSLAHGGKDGHPYPVPLRVYDETLRVLRQAVDRAKLGNEDRAVAIRKLDAEARRLEATANGPGFDEFVREERAASATYGGKTVFELPSPSPS